MGMNDVFNYGLEALMFQPINSTIAHDGDDR
jgi:hypothetical protein